MVADKSRSIKTMGDSDCDDDQRINTLKYQESTTEKLSNIPHNKWNSGKIGNNESIQHNHLELFSKRNVIEPTPPTAR